MRICTMRELNAAAQFSWLSKSPQTIYVNIPVAFICALAFIWEEICIYKWSGNIILLVRFVPS